LLPNARTEDKGSVDESRAGNNSEFDDQTTRWFRVPYRLVEPGVLLVDLFLVIAISLIAGIGYNWFFFGIIPAMETYAAIGVLTFTNVCAILAARGDYRITNLLNFPRQARDLAFTWTFVLFVLIAVIFALKVAGTFSRGATFTFFVLGLGGMIAWRAFVARFLEHALSAGGFASRSVILIGERSRLVDSLQMLELQRCGYTAIQTFEIGEEDVATTKMSRNLRATINSAIEVAQAKSVAEIFLLIGWEHSWAIDSISSILRVAPIPVYLLPDDNITRYLGRATVRVGTTWAAEVQRSPLTRIEQLVKRSIDLVGASLVLLLLSPLMLLTALLVKLDSPGPILFFQNRNGFNGRRFQIVKFRTMHVLENGTAIRQVTRADPRVTRVGRWLRRTSIDELPQLFNVLSGSMSLVGPRPHAIAHNSEYETLIANYAFRHHVKPGITGWAQIHGLRGETSTADLMAKRVEYDLWYIANWSLWRDFSILFRTLFVVLQSTAY
jgi:Undecaprenyl-phosphate glucose phosphotransferase